MEYQICYRRHHLNNILTTITDRRIGVYDVLTGQFDHYEPEQYDSREYYAFGSESRRGSNPWTVIVDSKQGFNNKEKYTVNNPIQYVDPDGRNYFEREDGKILWFNSTEKSYIFDKKLCKNIGDSFASFDGNYLNYHYQKKDKNGNIAINMQSFTAVSGRPDGNGNFDYSKENQMNPSTGPIPEGSYTMNVKEAPNMTTYKNLVGTIGGFLNKLGIVIYGTFPGGRVTWGDGRIDINPDKVFVKISNNPFDLSITRGGFTIHGGSTPGSAGCIHLCSGFSKFKSMVEQSKGNINEIKLKVKYIMVRPVPSRF